MKQEKEGVFEAITDLIDSRNSQEKGAKQLHEGF